MEKAICPKCQKRGGVTGRSDAYVNFDVMADGTRSEDTSVSEFDHTDFECTLCEESLSASEIADANGVENYLTIKYA